MKGFYIYGIRECSSPPKTQGVERTHVYTVSHKDIEAVVSEVELKHFEPDVVRQKLQDIEWAEPQVRAHAEVLEESMHHAPVIPWKFGTVFRTKRRLRDFLKEHCTQLGELLDSLRGTEEWGLKVYVERGALEENIRGANSVVKQLERNIASTSQGAAFFLQKKRETLLAAEGEKQRVCIRQEVFCALGEHAEQKVQNALLDKRLTRREEDMILNGAFLVREDRRSFFVDTVQGLEKTFAPQGFSFDLSGPWPPYNFVKLQ